MITIHEKAEQMIRDENNFELFRHNGLLCCVQRMGWSGNLNGYVAVTKEHPLYGKEYGDSVIVENVEEVEFNGNYIGLLCRAADDLPPNMLSIDLAINVHGGITFSKGTLNGIEDGLFGELWWFGFDTAHAGDLRPFQTDIDRRFDSASYEEYRDFAYVKNETKSLADQLLKFMPQTPPQ